MMFCYCEKQLLLALGLVLFEFNANEKCQVSLVVKYIKFQNPKGRRPIYVKSLIVTSL